MGRLCVDNNLRNWSHVFIKSKMSLLISFLKFIFIMIRSVGYDVYIKK